MKWPLNLNKHDILLFTSLEMCQTCIYSVASTFIISRQESQLQLKPLTYGAKMDGKPLFTEAVIVSTMKSKYSTEQQT